ncbi:hypothetical protein Emin_1499 [Elusimicrobium minutum Pei191]|uniref:Outer membrane protein beta-barrel domain-containing protein n=1 Tax=Elusimicrobium minutum (strain Pei191) TaxID=445932 RepID=B2KEV1_ELUMP|nr:outer membrane beta-barrel protein [Elusimicrobium minutum]ACC99047.1 hypothetical protein Emin_1499 [Elusimicrobium minutum Pei191]
MKKILALCLMFAAVNVMAGIDGGLEAGQTRIGVYGGISMPQDWTFDYGIGNFDEAPGETGPIFGAEIIRTVVPAFSVGLDVSYATHGDNKFDNNLTKLNSNVMSAHVVGRANFFAEEATRLYIPFGAGVSRFEAEAKALGMTDKAHETTFSFLAGVGFEFDLSPVWTMGIEGRYFYMPLDKDKFANNDKFDSFNLLLKLGARF